jgi:hypothetical protein
MKRRPARAYGLARRPGFVTGRDTSQSKTGQEKNVCAIAKVSRELKVDSPEGQQPGEKN